MEGVGSGLYTSSPNKEPKLLNSKLQHLIVSRDTAERVWPSAEVQLYYGRGLEH